MLARATVMITSQCINRMTAARGGTMISRRTSQTAAAALVLAAAFATSASASHPGCEYKDIDVSKYGEQPFQNPPQGISHNGVLDTRLVTRYTDPNAVSIGGCGVKLRTYNGQLVGPTLRIKPGDVMDILLDNRLPTETPA